MRMRALNVVLCSVVFTSSLFASGWERISPKKQVGVPSATSRAIFGNGQPGAIASDAIADDPPNDTFDPGPDIISLQTLVRDGFLELVVEFDDPIVPGDLAGYFAFDLDRNSATGEPDNASNGICGYTVGYELEIRYFPDEIDTVNGTVNVYDDTNTVVAQAFFEETTTSVTFRIPTNGGNVLPLTAAIVVGTQNEPTDCAIVSGAATIPAAIPALDPRALGLLAVALAFAAFIALRR